MKLNNTVLTLALVGVLALAALAGGLLPMGNAVHAADPQFVSGAGTRSIAENTPPGVNIGAPISATDADEDTAEYGNTLTYSLGGDDAASFDIDSSTGQLITKAPLDAEGTNTYNVTVTVDDGETRTGTCGTCTQAVVITVTDVAGSEPPLAPYPPTVVSGEDPDVADTNELSTTSLRVVWHPPERMGRPVPTSYIVQYKKSTETAFHAGDNPSTTDTEVVSITGTTATITGLRADTSYDVRVQATNGEGTDTWSLVGTGSTNKAGNAPPQFNTPDDTNCTDADICRTMGENEDPGQNVGTAMPSATDSDSVTKTYELTGPDADSFVFDTSARRIRTKRGVTYDFEEKSEYWVTVTVSDGHGATDAERVKITLIDVAEPPTAPARPTVRATEEWSTRLDVSWNAPDNTGRPGITGYVVQYREGTSGSFETTPTLDLADNTAVHTMKTSFTITGGDAGLKPGTSYQVQVRAQNAEGIGAWSVVGTGRTSAANREPEFIDGAGPITRYVDENTLRNTQAVRTVGARVAASDRDGDKLYYSLTPDDDSTDPDNDAEFFTIDENSGQIRTKSVRSHEADDCGYSASDVSTTCTYTVTVVIRDRKDEHRNDAKDEGADDTIVVNIGVRDLNEPPAAPAVTVTAPGDGTTLAVIWDAPDNTGPAIDGYEVEHREGSSGSWTSQTEASNATAATITTLTANTSHQVRVRATTGTSDEGDGAWSRTLTVYTNKSDNTAPTPSTTTALSVEENTQSGQNIGDPIAATETDADDVVTYSLEGPHASLFTIDSGTGQIRTRAALNHEAVCSTADAAGGHADNCTYSVVVKAVDRNRGSAASRVTITVTDDTDEPPSAPAAPTVRPTTDTSRSLDVSWREPQNAGPPITGYDIRYRKGEDGDFTIRSPDAADGRTNTGETSATITGLESGTDYQVWVRAISAEAVTDEGWSAVTKARTAQGNKRPEFETSGPVTLRVVENTPSGRDVGSAFLAEDADGSRNRLRYTLEGPGAASFTINAGTGQIRTKSPVDYESREFYSLTVKVDDSARQANSIAAKSVTVRVEDDIEPPSAPRAPRVTPVSGSTTSVLVTWEEPINEGPPIEYYKVDYSRADNRTGGFDSWTHERIDRSTIITGLTAGTRYVVRVAAHNAEGTGPWSSVGSGAPNRDTANRNPAFSGGSHSLSVAENTPPNTDVGAPIAATDQDGDPLRYSLEGPDAGSFEIVSTGDGGQVRTVAALNHEEKARYSVTVRVTDGRGGSDAVTVTITVTDEPDEAPSAPDAPTVTTVSSTSLQVSWEAPDNQGPPINDYDYRYREASEQSWNQVTNTTITATTVTIESLKPGTFYDVEVRARNDEGVSDWSIAGFQTTAAPGANNPPVFTEGASATRSVSASEAAGTNIGDPLTATDVDTDDTLTYSLEGTDAASFDIGVTNGQLSTKSGVTLAADSTYTVTVVASDGTDAARIDVTIEVTAAPPNNPPVFEEGTSTTRSVRDDVSTDTDIGGPVRATDQDTGDTLTYSLEGTDAASFFIASTNGQIRTLAALDASTKSTYSVTVRVTDGKGGNATIAVTINITAAPTTLGCGTRGAVADRSNTGLVADCEALLKATAKLENGARILNWSVSRPITEWDGIRGRSGALTGTPQRVTELWLHNLGLNGTIPAELGELSELKLLYLHRNNLTGEIPGELNNLSKLERLYVYDNELTGISSQLGSGMTNLRRLFAQRNRISGSIPANLGNMPRLDFLRLDRNSLTGSLPSQLGNLDRLRRLYLHEQSGWRAQGGGLTGTIPSTFGNMTRLEYLVIHRNSLSGPIPSELANLSNLIWLGLYDNGFTGQIPTELGSLSNLERLYVHRNGLSGQIPASLSGLTSLTNLWLKNNSLSGTIPFELGILDLNRLRISGNAGLTGCVPAGLVPTRSITDSAGRVTAPSHDIAESGLQVCN